MANVITTVGWFGFVLAAVYFVVYDRFAAHSGLDYVHHTRDILIVSAALVVGGYVLQYLGSLLGSLSSRCKKCGKRIDQGEMFCFNHRIETIHLAQDRVRAVETGKYKKPQLHHR